MLAGRRKLSFRGAEITRTPLVVPSFSSKGFPTVQKILSTVTEVITETVLVSAYDIHYKEIETPIDFANLVFLDSGGYEASKDSELSELGYVPHEPKEWTDAFHKGIVEKWKCNSPTVLISYDHPKVRVPFKEQVDRARKLFADQNGMLSEILVKPETDDQKHVQIVPVLEQIKSLDGFDVVGFAEKELGSSIHDRMINIAKVRRALERAGLHMPIHIFGSMDTVTTPLYFISGADIFDGLSWLRYSFANGHTLSQHAHGAIEFGIGTRDHLVRGRSWFNNVYYLADLSMDMRRFLDKGDFGAFKYHSDFLRRSSESLREALKGS